MRVTMCGSAVDWCLSSRVRWVRGRDRADPVKRRKGGVERPVGGLEAAAVEDLEFDEVEMDGVRVVSHVDELPNFG